MTRFLVRCVPERLHFVEEMEAVIPGLERVMDKHRHAMLTFMDAMREAGDDAAVHFEDDAQLCTDFMQRIAPWLEMEFPVQFFSRTRTAAGWQPGGSFAYTICFYLPPGMSKEILHFAPAWPGHKIHRTGFDLMMADYFSRTGMGYWKVMPSLVQHRETVSAINPRRSTKRQTKAFAG